MAEDYNHFLVSENGRAGEVPGEFENMKWEISDDKSKNDYLYVALNELASTEKGAELLASMPEDLNIAVGKNFKENEKSPETAIKGWGEPDIGLVLLSGDLDDKFWGNRKSVRETLAHELTHIKHGKILAVLREGRDITDMDMFYFKAFDEVYARRNAVSIVKEQDIVHESQEVFLSNGKMNSIYEDYGKFYKSEIDSLVEAGKVQITGKLSSAGKKMLEEFHKLYGEDKMLEAEVKRFFSEVMEPKGVAHQSENNYERNLTINS